MLVSLRKPNGSNEGIPSISHLEDHCVQMGKRKGKQEEGMATRTGRGHRKPRRKEVIGANKLRQHGPFQLSEEDPTPSGTPLSQQQRREGTCTSAVADCLGCIATCALWMAELLTREVIAGSMVAAWWRR
eukprot:359397-Chlamydomonas_euryale.AAC.6